MTTDEPAVRDPEPETGSAPAGDAEAEDRQPEDRQPEDRQPEDRQPEDRQPEDRRPSWWHRDHPTFSALTGFFSGLLFVALVPAVYVAGLSLVFDNEKVEDLFPFVLVTLVVPLALVVNQRTRRFGTYFWIGIVLTALVVIGVGALVLWFLVEHQN